MRGGVQGKKRRPSSAHSLLSLPWAPNPGSGLTSSIRKPSRTIPNPPHPHPCQELLHASVCMRVCLWCPELPGGAMWPPSDWGSSSQDSASCQSRDSRGQSFRWGTLGGELHLSLPVWGLPGKTAVSSLELRVKGAAQAYGFICCWSWGQ